MTTLDRAFIKAYTDAAPRAAAVPESHFAAVQAPPRFVPRSEPAATLPLSSFAPRPQVHDASRAMLEVDRMAWPAPAVELVAAASRAWETFTAQVVERAAQGQKCLALASPRPGDGRTTVALALARQVAARGLRPVVVDVDPANPALVRACGVSVHTGWDDLVSSELPLGEALILAVEDGVTLLPWRGEAQTLAQVAGSLRTAAVFGTLREQYDLAILDVAPLAARTTIADFAALASAVHVDGVYLVHNVRTTTREELSAACSKLRRAGLAPTGVIENFVTAGHLDPAPNRFAALRPGVAHG